MNGKHIRRDDDLGEIFQVGGLEIYVNESNVGRVPDTSNIEGPSGPSGVDYYYNERGYGCTSAKDVAEQFYRNFYER